MKSEPSILEVLATQDLNLKIISSTFKIQNPIFKFEIYTPAAKIKNPK